MLASNKSSTNTVAIIKECGFNEVVTKFASTVVLKRHWKF